MTIKRENAPHEGLFIKIFKNLDNTRHFLKKHISRDLQKCFDLDTLRLENTTYVDKKLRKHYSDLVFSVRLVDYENQFARIYLLFEHKSSPDPLTGVQVLKYMALQWLELQDQYMLVDGKLPPIIPIVIYQGQDADRRMCSSFHDLMVMPSEVFKVYIPDFSFAFFNVRGIDKETVQEKILLKFYVEIIKRQNDPGIKEIPSRLVRGLLESLERRTALEYIEIFFKYLVKSAGYLEEEDYKKALELLPEGGEKIMETLADQWMEQGAQEERQRAEEWLKQEKGKWTEQAKLENAQETLIDVATEQYGPLPSMLHGKIKSIQFQENLRALHRKVIKTKSLEEFTDLVNRAAEN